MLSACGGGGGGSGASAPAAVANLSPRVLIEAPESANSGETVTLDGGASSDPDGSIRSYAWSQTSGTAVVLSGSTQPSASFTAPAVSEPTSLAFSLTVTDNDGAAGTGSVSVSVQPSADTPRFTVSGRLGASVSQSLDLTTNDPLNANAANDSFDNAQPLPNPTTVGGYLNEPGSGTEGRSLVAGDVEDFYRVNLFQDQSITLLVANAASADADLYLYDASGNLVDFSIDTAELESVSVPADGVYFVNVSLFAGATLYNLAIGSGVPVLPAAQRYANVLPDQAIIHYQADDADPALDPEATETRLSDRLATRRIAGGRGRDGLFSLPAASLDAASARSRLGRLRERRRAIADDNLRDVWRTLVSIKRLAREPGVAAAEPNYRVSVRATPNDEAYPLQWHYPLINLPAAWRITNGSPEVIVAVVDTGILSGHPDLAGQLVPGYDFIRDPESAGDGDGIDPDPEDVGTGNLSGNFHGTHVTGTVAAAGNNRIGVAGAAWGVRVMPLRALGTDGAGTSYDIGQAVRFAAGLANDSGTLPAQRADIINLSLGGEGFSQFNRELYREVRRRGISVVAAAGNESRSEPDYPAGYADVFSVSAIDAQRNVAPYSNRGSSIDLAAPGGDSGNDVTGDGYPDGVLSTGAADGGFAYTFASGTSMAAPHVSAVLALMKSVNPGLSADNLASLLAAGELTDDAGDPGRDDDFGIGIINAGKAVDAAVAALGDSIAQAPSISVSSDVLNFGGRAETLQLVVAGTGNARVTSLATNADWLTVHAQTTDGDGLGRYQVRVNRSALEDGIYRGEILVRSTANTRRVKVLLAVGSGEDAELGTLYVLLYDPAADSVTAQTATRSSDGYRFRIPRVPAGDYLLFAGTDLNNNLRICDAGEACGALLTLDQPLRLRVDRDIDDADFPVEYQIAIPGRQSVAPASSAARALRRAR
ncbi:serine protease [Chromatocurvus halotolerans]|uniref:Serine protease n=2 Tax=Chromatocurvus halotolerans TaxID=1132028 RepID=A0A4R2KRM2_9GAMM|nr:serine protease [Chromatocurvus halotolerans]